MTGKPFFIVFEGIDGSGKSTQAGKTADYLASRGIRAVSLAEPTNGPHGREIRRLLRGGEMPPAELQLRLFLLDREEDVRSNILPALSTGASVVMDRYYFSNAAYQGASGLDPRSILEMNIERGFPRPDRVYLVDMDPAAALDRVQRRSDAGMEVFEKFSFLEKVRQAYLDIADDTFAIIDGSGDEEPVSREIIKDLNKYFGLD